VVEVDHEPMPVLHRFMAVRMAVRLRALPALVLVPVMLVVDMTVLVAERLVNMLQNRPVQRRPDARGSDCRRGHQPGQ
jgi:hypothetical protein